MSIQRLNTKTFTKAVRAWCKDYGVKVDFAPGWDNTANAAQGDWQVGYLIGHDTGTGVPASRLRVNHSQEWICYGRKDALAVAVRACNSYTRRDGTLVIIAAYKTWHAGVGGPYQGITSMNAHSWGHESESQGGVWDLTPGMNYATTVLYKFLLDYFNIPLTHLINHKTWAPGRKIDTMKPDTWWQNNVKDLAMAITKKDKQEIAKETVELLLNGTTVNTFKNTALKEKKKVTLANLFRLTADRLMRALARLAGLEQTVAQQGKDIAAIKKKIGA